MKLIKASDDNREIFFLPILQSKMIITKIDYQDITIVPLDWLRFDVSDRLNIEKAFYEYNYPFEDEIEEDDIMSTIDECYSATRCYIIINKRNNRMFMYESLLLPLNSKEKCDKLLELFDVGDNSKTNFFSFGLLECNLDLTETVLLLK